MSGDLNDIHFVDSNHGVTVGATGTVRKTDDGGDVWSVVDCDGTGAELTGVYLFSGTLNGIVVGAGGVIKAYTGTGCTAQSSGVITDLADVHCVPDVPNACWVVGKGGTILSTTDGGAVWSIESAPSTATDLTAVFMVSTTVGYAVGSGGAVWKYNGETWSTAASPGTSLPLNGAHFFIDDTSGDVVGYVVGDAKLLSKTIDGGSTWSPMDLGDPGTTYDLLDIACSSVMKCYVATSNQGGWGNRFVLRTNDGGVNWEAHSEWEGSWNAVSVYIADG